jgi:hypothetical protein
MMKTSFKKTIYHFLLAVIVFIPFQSLAVAILGNISNLPAAEVFWLAHWYEPVSLLLLPAIILSRIVKGNISRDRLWLMAIGLIAFGFVTIITGDLPVGRMLEGFRFTLFPILIFLLASSRVFRSWEKRTFVTTYLVLALLIAILAVVERFLPPHYLEFLGILPQGSLFGFGNFTIVEVYQSSSLIGAPNQLATYLLPALFLFLIKAKRGEMSRLCAVPASTIIALAILFTFSRSALIGAVFALLVSAMLYFRDRYWSMTIASSLPFFVLIPYLVYIRSGGMWWDLFTHGASQTQHAGALEQSLTELGSRLSQPGTLFFGSGLGSAGPLVLKYGDGLVSESWYLQLFLELGLIGFMLWFFLIIAMCKRLIDGSGDSEKPMLALGLIAVLVAALFLHTLSDNPAVSITLFILIGVYATEDAQIARAAQSGARE